MIRMHCSDITVIGRITSGVKLMNIGKDGSSFVASVAKLARSEESEDGEADDVTISDEDVEATVVDEYTSADDQSVEDIEDEESTYSEE